MTLRNKLVEYMKDKGKRTLSELLFGTVFIDIVAIVGIVFCKNKLAYVLGLLIGCMVACFMGLHMYSVLEKAILLDKEHAKRKAQLGAFVRMLLMLASLAISVLFPDYVSIVGVMIGVLSLKLGAEFQPLTTRFFDKIFPDLKQYYDEQSAIEAVSAQESDGDSKADELADEDLDDIAFIFGKNEELRAAVNEAVNFKTEGEADNQTLQN